MLRVALAANTIGGRAGEESKWRSDGRRGPAGPGILGTAGARARRERTRARGTFPQGVQSLLRAIPPGVLPQQQQHARSGRAIQTTYTQIIDSRLPREPRQPSESAVQLGI